MWSKLVLGGTAKKSADDDSVASDRESGDDDHDEEPSSPPPKMFGMAYVGRIANRFVDAAVHELQQHDDGDGDSLDGDGEGFVDAAEEGDHGWNDDDDPDDGSLDGDDLERDAKPAAVAEQEDADETEFADTLEHHHNREDAAREPTTTTAVVAESEAAAAVVAGEETTQVTMLGDVEEAPEEAAAAESENAWDDDDEDLLDWSASERPPPRSSMDGDARGENGGEEDDHDSDHLIGPSETEQSEPESANQVAAAPSTEESENGWGDDELDLSASEHHPKTTTTTTTTNPSATAAVAAASAPSTEESEENAWGGDDDLDLSASEKASASRTPEDRPANATNVSLEKAPGSIGLRLAASEVEVAGQLDDVLRQIEDQESGHNNHRGDTTAERINEDDLLSASDEEHQEQAVQGIQKEIQKVDLEQQQQQQQQNADSSSKPVAVKLVDHLPSRHGPAPASNVSVRVVVPGGDDADEYEQGPVSPHQPLHVNVMAGNNANSTLGDESVYDDENELNFGPVVDHTPTRHAHAIPQGSLAVQAGGGGLDDDDDDDDDDVESDDDAATGDRKDTNGGANIATNDNDILKSNQKVVDHLPMAPALGEEDGERATNGRRHHDTTLSVGVLASVDDCYSTVGDVLRDDDKDDEAHEFGPVVDLIPPTPALEPPASIAPTTNSLAVAASEIEEDFEDDEAMEETVDGWGDDDSAMEGLDETEYMDAEEGGGDDDFGKNSSVKLTASAEETSSLSAPKRASFSATLVTVQRHLVDHCPSEIAENGQREGEEDFNDPSIVALAMSEDLTRDTGLEQDDEEVYDDENEQEYGPVVDHTPPTPHTVMTDGANSMAVHASALKEDIEEDEAMDLSYHGGASSIGNDDSTDEMGGGSGWNDDHAEYIADRKPAAKEKVTLVDHTPSEMESPVRRGEGSTTDGDPSVAVLPSEADTRGTGEVDSTGENENVYGLVVDQTPATPAASLPMARSDSVLVQRGEDELDTVDETTAVDSTGGENVYGPVVDQTPTTPAAELARSDSVVVQGQDDVDTVDEFTAAGEPGDETDTFVDELPTESRAMMDDGNQLVDFIPRPESRFGDASTLVAADPSEVLSEVDDMAPEEQNFGPVVDQTPPSRPGAIVPEHPSGEGSTAVFVPPSLAADDLNEDGTDADGDNDDEDGWEHDGDVGVAVEETHPNPQSGNDEPVVVNNVVVNEQVVDFVPPPDENFTEGGDTTRAALSQGSLNEGRSLLQGGDPVEDDFGPVVDQIPGMAARASSHESTATQLTASECQALEKDDRANGRSDDASSVQRDDQAVVDHLPNFQAKRPLDSTATLGRSQASVDDEEEEEDASKFGPVVDQLPTSRASLAPSRGGSTVDALATVSEVDSDDGEGGWDDDDPDFDASLGGVSEGAALSTAAVSATRQDRNVSVRFDSSVNGSSHKAMEGPSLHSVTTSETMYYDPAGGHDVENDDGARLPEFPDKSFAEADTPPSTPYRKPEAGVRLESTDEGIDMSIPLLPPCNMPGGFECKQCSEVKTVDCPCVKRLLKFNTESGAVVGSVVTPDGDTVKIDFSQLLQDEIMRRKLAETELKTLKSTLDSEKTLEKSKLETEISELRRANKDLSHAVLEHENESANLREKNTVLVRDLSACRNKVTELESLQANAVAKTSAFEAQVENLKTSLASVSTSSGDDVTRRLTVTQGVLAAKTGECQELRTRVAQLEENLQTARTSNAEQSKETAELHAMLKQSISELKDKLNGSDKLVKTTEQARKELERKLNALDKEVNNLRASSQQMSDLQIQHEKNLQQQYKLLDKKTTDIHTLEKLVSTLQAEKAQITAELEQQRSLASQSESLANELVAVAEERDLLEQSLRESKDALEKLQKIIEEHGMERKELESKREEEHTSLQSELLDVTSKLSLKEEELAQLSGQIGVYLKQNEKLQADLVESRDALAASELAVEEAKILASANEKTIAQRDSEIAELEAKFKVVSSDNDRIMVEVEEATTKITELEGALKVAKDESDGLSDRNAELETEISNLNDRAAALKDERDTAASMRDESDARCNEFEDKYSSAVKDFEEKIQAVKQEYEQDISKLKAAGDELREEVARLQEEEKNHAQALSEVEKTAVDEASYHEEMVSKLNAECDVLREEIARLKELEVQQARSLDTAVETDKHRAVDEQNSEKIEDLLGEVANYKKLQESAAENIELLQNAMSEESRKKDADAAKLKEQCEELRGELARLQEAEAEKTRAIVELDATTKETARVYEEDVAKMKSEIADLKAQVANRKAVEEELGAERDRLGEVMRECDILTEENEDMLVQLGLAKQEMDKSEERARSLQAEIDALRASADNEETINAALDELRAINTDLESRVQAAVTEKDALASKLVELESASAELQELRSKNTELEDQIEAAASERDALTAQVKQLETSVAEEEARRESVDSIVTGLESHTVSLEKQLSEKQTEIDDLKEQWRDIHDAEFDAKLTASEQECNDLKNSLADKENEIVALNEKIEKILDSSDMKTRKIEGLRKMLKEKEETHATLVDNLQDKQQALEGQLKVSNDRVKVAEAALEAKKQIVMVLKESELQISELETELKEKNKKVSELETTIDEKDRELTERPNVSENLEREVAALQKQIDVLGETLQSTRGRLASKEEEMDNLAARMRDLQAKRSEEASRAATAAIEKMSEEAERLRETIIGKAAKLKRSDSSRAEALKRIQEERRANAERIRQLSESVQRYYGSPTVH